MKTVSKRDHRLWFILICLMSLVGAVNPLLGQIIINELHYDPDESASPTEFVELFNTGTDTVNLSGWNFGNGILYTFPEDTLLHAGDYLMVVQDPDAFIEKYTASRRSRVRAEAVYGPFAGRLDNDGETIELLQADGSPVDRVKYGAGFPWPVVGDPIPPALPGSGPSIQLVNPLFNNELPAHWRAAVPTPDRPNKEVYTDNEPTRFQRKAQHQPAQPTSRQDVTITVELHDPDGIQEVLLAYQLVHPGNYIPLRYPRSISAMNDNPDIVPKISVQYAAETNWQYTPMLDDGTHGDAVADDQVYTAVLSAQDHRSLVRYRITTTDLHGASITVPYPEDASMNYAYFVYNGVPDYQGFSAEVMESLPVYHLITREHDLRQALGWDGQNRISQGAPAWFVYNWYGTLIYDGVVYDNIRYRLRGGNGRYFPYSNAKRRMRFRFNRDHYFQARDAQGKPYPTRWRTLTTHNGAELRGTLTYGFNEHIDFLLYNQIGVPAPFSYYFHLRVIDHAQEAPDPWRGDFWGAIFAQETYDSRFLEAHDLAPGNLYKLINSTNDAKRQQRYQAPDAVTNGADFKMAVSLSGSKSASYIENHVSLQEWNRYHALCQAIRHYDWPSGQRNKNAAWYFEPYYTAENDYLGCMWTLPYDLDASWGPNWNNGEDIVYVAVFANRPDRDPLLTAYYNEIREIRDLLWQKDQIEPLLDYHAAKILPFMEADRMRWYNAPSDAGSYNGLGGAGIRGLDALVQDMKDFAFVGGSWPGGSVGAGGRAAFLDRLADRTEGSHIPDQPRISYVGAPGFPGNALRFKSSAFDDPQGRSSFAALKWRVGEVDASADAGADMRRTGYQAPAPSVPSNTFKLEIAALWEQERTQFDPSVTIPGSVIAPGQTYRVRCKMKDKTGRWSHWSDPIQFVAGDSTYAGLHADLRITELMYHPADAQDNNTFDDNAYEFVELQNTGPATIDLTGLSLTGGINFSFQDSDMTQLAPGAFALVVKDRDAFGARYSADLLDRVAGEYTGRLSNAGETISLTDYMAGVITEFTYDDAWYPSTDGGGLSLIALDPDQNQTQDLSSKDAWRPSLSLHGSPGTE